VAAKLSGRPRIDFAALIKDFREPHATERERVLAGLTQLHAGLEELTHSAATCLETVKNCRQALAAGDYVALSELDQEEHILKQLLANHPEINSVIQEALRATRAQGEPRADDLSSNLELSQTLYEITHNGSRSLQQALEQSIKKGARL
jgi:polyribonucleotide nucleotidyltransferase